MSKKINSLDDISLFDVVDMKSYFRDIVLNYPEMYNKTHKEQDEVKKLFIKICEDLDFKIRNNLIDCIEKTLDEERIQSYNDGRRKVIEDIKKLIDVSGF